LEPEGALKPISEQLLSELDELAAIEREKRNLDPADDRTVALAVRARQLAQRVLGASVVEEQIALTANQSAERTPNPESLPPAPDRPRPLHVILDEWREAERAMEAARTPEERQQLRLKTQSLRDEYQAAFEALDRQDASRPDDANGSFRAGGG
jgi:hypothetical protein